MRKIGWSVLVEGRLSAVTDPVEADALDVWYSQSWAPGIRDSIWMRIEPTSITGRAITRGHGEAGRT